MSNGQVARFDGVNDYIDLGLGGSNELDIDGSNGFTVFARVNPINKSCTIVGRDGFTYSAPSNADRGFLFSHYGTSGPHFRIFNGTSEASASYSTSGYPADYFNNWHDLVGVFRPGEAVELWMDGELVDSTPTAFMSFNTPAGVPITIGRSDSTGSGLWYFKGDMESVALWDYDLTPGEIRSLAAPEPVAIVLLTVGLLCLVMGRRRR